jgi:hypothetical protein
MLEKIITIWEMMIKLEQSILAGKQSRNELCEHHADSRTTFFQRSWPTSRKNYNCSDRYVKSFHHSHKDLCRLGPLTSGNGALTYWSVSHLVSQGSWEYCVFPSVPLMLISVFLFKRFTHRLTHCYTIWFVMLRCGKTYWGCNGENLFEVFLK